MTVEEKDDNCSDMDALLSALCCVSATSDVCMEIINVQTSIQNLSPQAHPDSKKVIKSDDRSSNTIIHQIKSYLMIRFTILRKNLN